MVFKILSHFDVKREYNPGTGEQTNVISENTTDRPWYDRDYMRVDWSNNLVDVQPDTGLARRRCSCRRRAYRSTTYVTQDGAPNPDRPILTPSYFDFTLREIRTPDYDACFALFHPGIDDAGIGDCGPAQLKVRYSFLEAKPSTYVPLSYPDRQPLLDDSGQPIRLNNGVFPCSKQVIAQTGGADCSAAAVDQFSKFGFFRTVRQTYDPKYGATEQGRQYLANRWNIWKDAVAANKPTAPQPRHARDRLLHQPGVPRRPRAVGHGQDHHRQSWNDAMKQTVASLNLTQSVAKTASSRSATSSAAAAGLPDIFVLKKNSCNIQGVKDFVAQVP